MNKLIEIKNHLLIAAFISIVALLLMILHYFNHLQLSFFEIAEYSLWLFAIFSPIIAAFEKAKKLKIHFILVALMFCLYIDLLIYLLIFAEKVFINILSSVEYKIPFVLFVCLHLLFDFMKKKTVDN